MFTQTTISMYTYEAGFGRMPEMWAEVLHGRWRHLFRDEQERLKSNKQPYLFQGLPAELVDSLSIRDKHEVLDTFQRGWMKIAEPANFRNTWSWPDFTDVEMACSAALVVIDAKLNFMHSHTYQGPVRGQDMGCSQEAVTQAMLACGSSGPLHLRNTLTDEIAPKLAEAKMFLRARMGDVDVTGEYFCVQCDRVFSGAKGFVLIDATRRGGDGNGIWCLDCIGH